MQRYFLSSVSKQLCKPTWSNFARFPTKGLTSVVSTPNRFFTTPVVETKESAKVTEETANEDPSQAKKFSFLFGDLVVGTVLGVSLYFAFDYLTDFPEPCQLVLEYCKQSPFIEEHVGFPLSRSLLWYGTVNEDNYRVEIGVSGPKGDAMIHSMGVLGSNAGQPEWHIIRCDAAMEKFAYRLTDLMPADPRDNIEPYVPSPDDPSAQLPPGVKTSEQTPKAH